MYPLKLSKTFIEKPWGGRDLAKYFAFSLPHNALIGESWAASALPSGYSLVENGNFSGEKLADLITMHPFEMLGASENHMFPILIKFLDVHDRLSVQVHPDDGYAYAHENRPGKCESWYVLEASENASLILGAAADIDQNRFFEKMNAEHFKNLFNICPVKKGDFINIRPGTIHGTLEGSILLYEIQQSSDLTYRIYDYDRVSPNGTLRTLHIDKALDVIDFSARGDVSHAGTRQFEQTGSERRCILANNDHFRLDEIFTERETVLENDDSFRILTFISGTGSIRFNTTEYRICAGDSWFIPAILKDLILCGNLHILCAKSRSKA